MKTFTSTIHFLSWNKPISIWLKNFLIIFMFSLFGNIFHAQSQVATAPVNVPSGGFRIDGFLKANTIAGDWVSGSGPGGFIISNNGVPLNDATTWLTRDAYNSNLDIKFTEGSKGNSNPNIGWTWVQRSVQNKNDIHNAMIHISTDQSTGHTWLIGGGDRLDPSGSAYIDFEFLQNTLVRLGASSTGGGFNSQGPDGGRTINDLLMTMEYRNGGGLGVPVFYRWALIAPNTYDYVSLIPNAGTAFAYTNDGTVDVPFGAFGKTTYGPKLFVEGAVDMTALISNISSCLGLAVKTIMLKTKASPSTSAALMDLMEPLPVALNFGITVGASANSTIIDLAVSNTSQLQATASPAPNGLYDFSWVQTPAIGGLLSASNIANPIFTAIKAGSYTFDVTAKQKAAPNCPAKESVTINVISTPPLCGVSGPSLVCPGSINEYFYDLGGNGVIDNLPDNFSASWSLVENNAGAAIASSVTNKVSVTAGATCNSTYKVKLTLTSVSGLVTVSCFSLVMVEDKVKPSISFLPEVAVIECIGGIPTAPANLAAFISAGGIASDACDNALDYAVNTGELIGGTCGGTITRTFTVTDNCGNTNTCTQVFTVNDITAPSISCPSGSSVQCFANIPAKPISLAAFILLGGSASDNCDQSLTYEVSDGQLAGGACGGTVTRTHKVTDDCNNFKICTQVFTVNDNIAPVFTSCPADVYLNSCSASTAPANTGIPTATDNCSGSVIPSSSDAPPISIGCQKVIVRTWTAKDNCNNSVTCVQNIIVIDRTAPVIICPATPAGIATATDDCGTVTVISTISGNNKIWTAIDASGNRSSCTQSLSQNFVSAQNQSAAEQPAVVKKVEDVKAAVKPNVQSDFAKAAVASATPQPDAVNVSGIQISAYPNPFKNEVNFRFNSTTGGKALLELFDVVGRKVGTVYQGELSPNAQKTIIYRFPTLKSVPIIYKLSIGNEKRSGKLLPSKY